MTRLVMTADSECSNCNGTGRVYRRPTGDLCGCVRADKPDVLSKEQAAVLTALIPFGVKDQL